MKIVILNTHAHRTHIHQPRKHSHIFNDDILKGHECSVTVHYMLIGFQFWWLVWFSWDHELRHFSTKFLAHSFASLSSSFNRWDFPHSLTHTHTFIYQLNYGLTRWIYIKLNIIYPYSICMDREHMERNLRRRKFDFYDETLSFFFSSGKTCKPFESNYTTLLHIQHTFYVRKSLWFYFETRF